MESDTQTLGTTTETPKPKLIARWLEKISWWSVLAAIFLIPLFILPSTSNPFELNKALLFGILTVIAAIAWLGRMVFYRLGGFARTPLDLPIIIFGIFYAATTIFSKNWYVSLVGQTGYVHNAATVVVLFIACYFLITNLINSPARRRRAVETLLVSGFFVAVIALIHMLGGRILHWDFMLSDSFNPVFNSNIILCLFLISLIPFQLSWLITRRQTLFRWWLAVSLLLTTTIFVLIDANVVWFTLVGVLLVWLGALVIRSGRLDPRWIIMPTIMAIIAILLIFVDAGKLTKQYLPSDIVLDHGTSAGIASSISAQSPLYGTGPGMFSSAFSAYRPASFNNTAYWSLGFIKSGSEFWQLFTTTGVIVTGVYLLISLIFLISYGRKLWRERKGDTEWLDQLAPFLAWLVLCAAGFYYPFSFVLAFILWMYLALGMRSSGRVKEPIASMTSHQSTGLVSSLAFSVVAVLSIAFVYYGLTAWISDYHFTRGNNEMAVKHYQSAQLEYSKAIDRVNQRPEYYFALAQANIDEVVNAQPTSEADLAVLRGKVDTAIAAGNSGIAADQENVSSYQAMIGVYLQLSGYSQPSHRAVNELYDQLIEKDPKNPLVRLGSGDALVAYGQVLEQSLATADESAKTQYQAEARQSYITAGERYQAAADLKKDYQVALLRKAALPQLTGDIGLAITQINDFLVKYPNNVEAQYEIAQLYLKQDDKAKAKDHLIAVLNINPQHANANYQLGVIVMDEGDKEAAKALFARVLLNNQTNEQVRAKLTELGVNPDDLLK